MQDTFFYPNQKLIIPQLSQSVGITSHEFIVEDILQGGMGTCIKIRGFDSSFYALKIIHSSLLENETELKRYMEEMKTWLTLSACNGVVEAIVITRINEIPCIAAHWMQSGDLCKYVKTVNPYFFYHTFDRIITTLDWAFSKYSIIHRDLKPANILLDSNNDAFIADWGLARPISKPNNEQNFGMALSKMTNRVDLTQAGQFMGTIVYASPEQIMGLPNIDHRSDIYSLGCMMYEWETGELPFLAPTAQEIATLHLQVKPRKIGGFLKSTNYKVENIIAKCMEKDPNKRYQTYKELLFDFQSVACKNISFKPFKVSERYKMPIIGENEFSRLIKEQKLKGVYSQDGKHAIFDWSDVEPYFREADNLAALGEFQKARDIYARFFNYEHCAKFPDLFLILAVNYGFTLYRLGKIDEAIAVIKTVEKAQNKPAEYYLNLSLSYLAKKDFINVESLCKPGLNSFPNDTGLIGNLTIALSFQDKLEEAQEWALKRLKISRDVHSLEEAALVIYEIAEKYKNTDFPTAIKHYKLELSLLLEAKELNPHFTTARYSLANVLFKLQKYSESSTELSEINKIEKGTTEIGAFYMARNLLFAGAFDASKDFCLKWLQSFSGSIYLKRVLSETIIDGLYENRLSKFPDYQVTFDLCINFLDDIICDKVNRLSSDFQFLSKGYALIRNDYQKAFDIVEKGIKEFPNEFTLYFWKSSMLFRFKEYELSLQEAMIALEIAPWEESVPNLIFIIYKTMGNIKDAEFFRKKHEILKAKKQELYNSAC